MKNINGFHIVTAIVAIVTLIVLSNYIEKFNDLKHQVNYLSGENVSLIKGFHYKSSKLEIDSLKMVIIKMNNNQNILNNQFLNYNYTQTQLNKEMFRNAQMQLQINNILSKRIDSK